MQYGFGKVKTDGINLNEFGRGGQIFITFIPKESPEFPFPTEELVAIGPLNICGALDQEIAEIIAGRWNMDLTDYTFEFTLDQRDISSFTERKKIFIVNIREAKIEWRKRNPKKDEIDDRVKAIVVLDDATQELQATMSKLAHFAVNLTKAY